MTNPTEHLVDAQKLTADAYVDLFIIQTVGGGTLHLKDGDELTYQADTYESVAIKLEGVGASANDERSRPVLSVVNPLAVFSALVGSGALDGAYVTRKRVLRTHIDGDNNISRSQTWRVTRTMNLNRNTITLELRDQLDGQFFLMPGRMFVPPEFPQVSLS